MLQDLLGTLWDIVVVAFLTIVVCVGFAIGVALLKPAFAHDQYKDWTMPDRAGVSCCNDHDCAPTRAYLDPADDHWRAQNPAGEWVIVPPNKVMKGPSPDGRTHWCGVGSITYCFMLGDTKS